MRYNFSIFGQTLNTNDFLTLFSNFPLLEKSLVTISIIDTYRTFNKNKHMIYNNFSDGYKKILIASENRAKEVGLRDLQVEDVFLEIIKNSSGGIKEIFSLYGIDSKLTLEIINKGLFNKKLEERKGVYGGMGTKLKEIILGSVKIAASYSKSKATLEDFLISLVKNDAWFPSFLEYVGINSSDIETNFHDLEKIGTIDGAATGSLKKDTFS